MQGCLVLSSLLIFPFHLRWRSLFYWERFSNCNCSWKREKGSERIIIKWPINCSAFLSEAKCCRHASPNTPDLPYRPTCWAAAISSFVGSIPGVSAGSIEILLHALHRFLSRTWRSNLNASSLALISTHLHICRLIYVASPATFQFDNSIFFCIDAAM